MEQKSEDGAYVNSVIQRIDSLEKTLDEFKKNVDDKISENSQFFLQ